MRLCLGHGHVSHNEPDRKAGIGIDDVNLPIETRQGVERGVTLLSQVFMR